MVSDAKGRKKAILISFLAIFSGIASKIYYKIGSFTGAYFHIIFLVILGQFLIGFGAYAMVTLCYTLLADFCSDSLRSRAVVIINSVWYTKLYLGDFPHLCLEFIIWLNFNGNIIFY